MFESIDEKRMDVLREVCSVGAGHAATALSQIIGKRIDLEVPRVILKNIQDVPQVAGGPEAIVAGLYFQILGDARGNIFMIFPEDSAHTLVSMMRGGAEDLDLSNEINLSAMKEVGNILTSAFLNAISQLAGLSLIPSVPGFACDMAGSILDYVLIELSRLADKALVIETEFKESGAEIKGHFFLLPDPHSLHIILRAVERDGSQKDS